MAERSLYTPKVIAKMDGFVRNTLDDGLAIDAKLTADINDTLTSGLSASQANRGWQWKERTIPTGGSVVIDLYDFAGLSCGAGAGNDMVGQPLLLDSVVAILIKNENAVGAAGTLEVEPDATNGWTPIGSHTVATGGGIRGGGFLFKYQPDSTGFAVTDGASHRVKLTAAAAAVEYSIWIWGRYDDESSSSSSSSLTSSASSQSSSSSSKSSSSASSKSSSSPSSSSSATSSSSSSSVTSSASSASSASSSSEG